MTTLQRMALNTAEIERRRKALTLTMEEAAERAASALRSAGQGRIKFNRQRWCDIESGRYHDIRLSTLEAVCTVLGCGVDDLRTRGGGRR